MPASTPDANATGALLWVRAVVLAVVALVVGGAAHVQADGLLPGAGVLVALALAGSAVCAPLLRRPGSTRRIIVLLVAGQSAVHVALSAAAGHRGDPVTRAAAPPPVPALTTGSRSGSYFDVAYASRLGDTGGGLSVPSPLVHAFADISAHPTMAVAHLLAAAACGWWLARGERALWALLDLSARRWVELAAVALGRWVAAARAVVASALSVELPASYVAVVVSVHQSLDSSSSVSRRGPPRTA